MTANAKIYLASDHAGAQLRNVVVTHVASLGLHVVDLGPTDGSSVDYPDYGEKLALALSEDGDARGVAICGSGIGISIAVNRFPWVRAALVGSVEAAKLSREHNNANVIALGERLITQDTSLACIDVFLSTDFEGGRHERRVDKFTKLSP